jgi:hypothetical protein
MHSEYLTVKDGEGRGGEERRGGVMVPTTTTPTVDTYGYS